MKRPIICGSRDEDDLGFVWSQLDAHHALMGPFERVIHGNYRGVDKLAAAWAEANDVPHSDDEFTAEWGRLGSKAGPLRNQRMIDEGRPDACIAFPGGNGTADMVRRARAAGLQIIEIAPETPP
jgi:hypothetical protein